MNKWISRFCFFIIIIFALIGAVFLSIVIHEQSHKADLERFITDDGEICFFAFPVNASLKEIVFGKYAAGYFMYNYKNTTTQETKNRIETYTEKKAFIIGNTIIILLIICVVIEVIGKIKNADAEEFYAFFNKWLEKNS